jgi:hypothetical protein
MRFLILVFLSLSVACFGQGFGQSPAFMGAAAVKPATGGAGGGNVTFDAVSSMWTNVPPAWQPLGLTNSFTVGSGLTDGYILVFVSLDETGTHTVTNVTYGTKLLAQLATIRPNNSASAGRIYVFGTNAPASGANNVGVAMDGLLAGTNPRIFVCAASFYNVGSISVTTATYGSGTAPAITITQSSGDMAAAWAATGTAMTAWPATDRVHLNTAGTAAAGMVGLSTGTATSYTATWTGGDDWWGVCGVRLIHD